MLKGLRPFIVIVLLGILSCQSNTLLEGFDSNIWKIDANGCTKQRESLVDEIMDRKSELFGHGQKDIIAVLGKPNRHELYSRNKKAFVYFVSGGAICSESEDSQEKVVIRFDGIGRAKEVIYYKN